MVENEPAPADSLPPELWMLLQAWRERREALGRMPLTTEIAPSIPSGWRHKTARIVPDRRVGFLVASCGFGLIRRFGRLPEGDHLGALAPDIRQPLERKLLSVLRRHEPILWRLAITLGRDPIHFNEIILPLSDGHEGIGPLLLAAAEEQRPRPKRPSPPDSSLPEWEQD